MAPPLPVFSMRKLPLRQRLCCSAPSVRYSISHAKLDPYGKLNASLNLSLFSQVYVQIRPHWSLVLTENDDDQNGEIQKEKLLLFMQN